jgi:carboxyl-terminal processing protease
VVPTSVALPSPQEYLERALTFIETYSARGKFVDVKAITGAARARGVGVTSIDATYPIIREALTKLGDRHSQLLNPTSAQSLLQGTSKGFGLRIYPPDVIWVTPGSPAELGGIRTLDRIVTFNAKPWNRTTSADRSAETAVVRVSRAEIGEFDVVLTSAVISTTETPNARVLDAKLGYLDVPGSIGSRTAEENFSRTGLAAIAAVEQAVSPCGWVLDLRRNSGGYVFSMMSVLEPFLSESTVSGFVFGDDRRELLSFRNGQLFAGARSAWQSETVVRLRDPNVPVAVLMSNFTGSAGELAAISFIGRPLSRSFGDQTVGVTSANVGIRLADGGFIMVTNSYDLDRAGNVYDQRLSADVGLVVDWATFGTDADPVLANARQWLSGQASCAAR